jgi:hypothetical protein
MASQTKEQRKAWREKCLAEGRCGSCGRPNKDNGATCTICRKRRSKSEKAKLEERKRLGVCTVCGNRKDSKLLKCKSCRDKNKRAVSKVSVEKKREYGRKCIVRKKIACMDAYGGPICVCCGVDILDFLCIDHIHRNGAEERKKLGTTGGEKFYRHLRDNGYPPGYQVLCYNCNIGRERNGGTCPHQLGKNESLPR